MIALTVGVKGIDVMLTGTVLLIPNDVSGFRFKVKLLVVVVVVVVVTVVVVVVDAVVDATAAAPYAPEKLNPNPKDVSPNIPAEVTGAPNEGPVAAVQVEESENGINSMVFELAVAAKVDAGVTPGGTSK